MGSFTPLPDLCDSAVSPAPDFSCEDDYEGIVDRDIAKRLSTLFDLRNQVRQIERMGALNKERALEWLLMGLEELEVDLKTKWENC